MQQISDNVYVETEYTGCNTGFVVTDDGIVMIDTPQIPEDAIKWREEISKYGEVRCLINTEPHQDHFTGNCFFEGTVIAHEGTREAILAAEAEPFMEYLAAKFPESVPLMKDFHFRPPAVTFTRELNIYLGDHTFQLINLPGHTACEVAVYIPEEGVVFTSDNLFGGVQPGLQQAMPYEWLDSLKKIGELGAAKLVPGHGHVCEPGYLAEFSAFLQDWISAVKDAISRGLSLEETQATVSFADRYPPEPNLPFSVEEVQRVNAGRLYSVLKEQG
jgi:cyclase